MKMKKVSVIIFMLMMISAITTSINATEEENNFEMIESLNFSEPNLVEIDQYLNLELKDASTSIIEPGNPVLPVITKMYSFPIGTKVIDIECLPKEINEMYIEMEIQPALEPRLLDKSKNVNENNFHDGIIKNKDVYENENFFPDKWFDYRLGTGIENSEHVLFLTLRLYPVQYSPGRNLIKYVKSTEIKVNYIQPKEPVVFPDSYDMVIITPTDFSEELQPLVDYKNDGTVDTILVTLDDIYIGTYFPVWGRDEQEQIKYFIKNAIENWGITYVLLAGGSNQVPVRYSNVPDGEEDNFVSDLYYADIFDSGNQFCDWDANENSIFGEYTLSGNIDQVDLFPDIYLGRLNLRSIEEITPVVNKIITYESTAAYLDDWFTDFVVCGGDTFEDSWTVDEGESLNQDAIDMMSGFSENKIWATNGKLEDGRNIDNAINNGAGFFYCSGHGTYSNWATHPHNDFDNWIPFPTGYRYGKVEALENGGKLPIVYIGGCSNSKFTGSISFTWSFIKNPNGGGISSYGYTALGWGYIGIYYDQGLVGGMELSFFRAYTQDNPETSGELWCDSLNNYISDYGAEFELDFKTIEEFEPFCDPSLRFEKISDRPNKPNTPEGETLGIVNDEYFYTSSAIDPNGDMIKYCFDWGDGTCTWSDWVSSGTDVSLSHIWDRPGFYDVKIKVRDQYGLDSPWSDTITMHIQGAIVEIDKISGGLFRVGAVIKNIGDIEVSDINWTIQVEGGMFDGINVFSEGTIDITMPVGSEESIRSDIIFGLGRVDITITASSSISNEASEKLFNKFVLGPFILI